jgi:hypothetical protein
MSTQDAAMKAMNELMKRLGLAPLGPPLLVSRDRLAHIAVYFAFSFLVAVPDMT